MVAVLAPTVRRVINITPNTTGDLLLVDVHWRYRDGWRRTSRTWFIAFPIGLVERLVEDDAREYKLFIHERAGV